MPAPVTWKQAAQADPDRKWRKLLRHPLWDEIEMRLRARWSPRKVVLWLEVAHPKETVSFQTLYRYLQGKSTTWFIDPLVVVQAGSGHSRVSRLMVMEEHAEAILTLKKRIARMLPFEETMNGIPIPEVRNNLELLARMTEQHLKMQQAMGYGQSGGFSSRVRGVPLTEEDEDNDGGFLTFVNKMVKLPETEFLELVRLALGPPPPGTEPVDKVSDVRLRQADDE